MMTMNSKSISEVESQLDSPEFIANPYPLLHRLRQEAPVYWSDVFGGWILTGYDEVVAFRDTSHFFHENRLERAVAYLSPEKRANHKLFEDEYDSKGLLHADPPEHTQLRALVSKEFNQG